MTLHELGWRTADDVTHLFLHHVLAIVDFKLALMQACLAQPIELSAWISDRSLRKHPVQVEIATDAGGPIQVSVVPDAVFRLRLPSGHTLSCCLEVDRGTSTLAASQWQAKSWQRKLLAYQALQEQGMAGSGWALPGMIVTTVTTSPTRLANLLAVCEAAGGGAHFWFTTFDRLTAETILTGAVWQVAGKGTK